MFNIFNFINIPKKSQNIKEVILIRKILWKWKIINQINKNSKTTIGVIIIKKYRLKGYWKEYQREMKSCSQIIIWVQIKIAVPIIATILHIIPVHKTTVHSFMALVHRIVQILSIAQIKEVQIRIPACQETIRRELNNLETIIGQITAGINKYDWKKLSNKKRNNITMRNFVITHLVFFLFFTIIWPKCAKICEIVDEICGDLIKIK